MPQATIMLAPRDLQPLLWIDKGKVDIVSANIDRFIRCRPVTVGCATAEDAAEEMFDLTNNPSRQEEREDKYGRGPSLSSGDVVEFEGVRMLCMSMGWAKL
jgi:hypothetical protein